MENGDGSFFQWNLRQQDYKSKWDKSCEVKIFNRAGMGEFDTIASENSIVDVAVNNAFTTLVELVIAANLADTLAGKGPFTVFAPTDAAFSKVGSVEELKVLPNLDQLLLSHVLNFNAPSRALKNGEVVTLSGANISVNRKSGVTVNGAKVVTADIIANNGVIHVIDAVINPEGGTF